MVGKILAENLISGSDGQRYSFEVSEIQNLENREIKSIIGSEVDFEINENKAVNIYVTKQPFKFDKDFIKSDDIPNIRLKAFIMYGCMFFGFIPILGQILAIFSFVLNVLIVLSLKKLSGSKTLLKNFILSLVTGVLAGVFIGFSIVGVVMASSGGNSFLGVLGIILALASSLAFIYYGYSYFKELSNITYQPFFLYSFYLGILGALTAIIYIGIIFSLIALVLQIVAWVKFNEVKKVA